jgi:CheY-like chemotaxis protein
VVTTSSREIPTVRVSAYTWFPLLQNFWEAKLVLNLSKDPAQPSDFDFRQGDDAMATGKSILLVEDERMIRDMLALDLQEQGAGVTIAVDGEEAIEFLKEHQPDLILLDILMPKKDGFAVLEFLRQQHSAIPVVMLTNLSSPDHERTCRDLGARDFIIKSELDTGELWDRVKRYM